MSVLPRIDGGAIRSRLVAFLVGVGFLGMPPRAPGQSLERELYRQAPEGPQGFESQGLSQRRRPQISRANPRDSAGLMNLNLANRLAVALVLRNHEDPPMGILRDANAVAAGLPGANHLTPDGRRLLFQARYALAWGSEKVMPDAFLTGAVKFNADFTKVTVNLSLVDKERGILNDVFPALEAFTEPANLIEAGESFLLRGFFDKGKIVKENAAQSAQKVRDQKEPFPLAGTANAPVDLAIRYDDYEVPLEIREGKALIQEPRDGQKVVFTLRRQGESKMRYKVVLKVNGLNSVGKERLPDLLCRGWVLEPDMKEVEIKGFQIDDQIADEFQAVSHALVGARATPMALILGRSPWWFLLKVRRRKN